MLVDGLPVHFSYEGDMAEVSKWIPYAKKLFINLKFKGTPVLNSTPTGDVEIHVARMNGYNKIHIKATTTGFISGFCSLHLDFIENKYQVNRTKGVNIVQLKGLSTSGYEKDQLLLDTNNKVKKPILRGNYTSEYPSLSYQGRVVQKLTLDLNDNYPAELNNSPFLKMPGMFTGEMRKVVQTVLGFGGPITFECSFRRSHGIFTNRFGKKYVIEVGERGIFASKLNCSYLDTNELNTYKTEINAPSYDLPYKLSKTSATGFSETDRTGMLESGKLIQVASASALSQFYSHSAYFDMCGWAFDSTGKNIQNTCWSDKPDDNPRWVYGYRYRIGLAEDNEGVPIFQGIVLEDSGYLHGSAISWWVPKNYSTLEHFDIFRRYFVSPPGPVGTTFYVFYDGDTEVKVGYLPRRDINDGFVDEGITNDVAATIQGSDVSYTRFRGTRNIGTVEEVYIDTPENYSATFYNGILEEMQTETILVGTFWPYDPSFPIEGGANPEEGAAKATKTITNGTAFGQIGEYVGIIPSFDRECVMIYHDERYEYTDSASISTGTGYSTYHHAGFSDRFAIYFGGGLWSSTTVGGDPSATITYTVDQLGIQTTGDLPYVALTSLPGAYPPGTLNPPLTDLHLSHSGSIDTEPAGTVRDFVSRIRIKASGTVDVTVDSTAYTGLLGNLSFSNGYDDPLLTIWYQSVVDAFTNNRMVSKFDTASGYSDMTIIGGKLSDYQSAASDSSRWKFFFGAP